MHIKAIDWQIDEDAYAASSIKRRAKVFYDRCDRCSEHLRPQVMRCDWRAFMEQTPAYLHERSEHYRLRARFTRASNLRAGVLKPRGDFEAEVDSAGAADETRSLP